MSAAATMIMLDGISISYTVHPGVDPTIICLHGNSLSKAEFADLVEQDAVSGNRIIAVDLPGHGDSDRPADTRVYSLHGYGRLIGELIDQLDIRDFVLVGVSLGGHIAFQSAAAGLVPRPRGIACFGSPPIGEIADFSRGYLPQPENLSLFRGEIDPATAREIANVMTVDKPAQEAAATAILATDPAARTALLASLGSDPLESEREFVTTTTIPIRLCYDRNERVVNTEYLSESGLAAGIPDSIVWFDGADHLPRMGDVARVLADLISDTGPAGG